MFATRNSDAMKEQARMSLQADISEAKYRLLQLLLDDQKTGDGWQYGMAPGGRCNLSDLRRCAAAIEEAAKQLATL